MTRPSSVGPGALMSVVVAMSCHAGRPPEPVSTSNPRFDWFEYRGDDSVYKLNRAGPNDYYNPILAGFYPDPTIIRVGDDYYVATSSFAYFPGVPIFHSKDLVHWTQIGHILDRPSQLNVDSAGVSRGIFAPALSYHDGTFYMITTLIDRGGNFYVTAKNPAGPWSDPVWLSSIDGIDPSFFFDDDGKSYILNNGPPVGEALYDGHRAIWIQQYDFGTKTLVGPRSVIVNGGVDLTKRPIWIEAPHIFKRDGTYYLICAEGGTADQHSEVVFRSQSVMGPYVPYSANPILTQRHLDAARPFPIETTGHADFVATPNGDWWAVFLGTRNYGRDLWNTGRETFLLPVTWVDGWPTILTGQATVPYVHARPNLSRQAAAAVPHSGNFSVRDEFDAPALAPYWEMLRTPRERWYDLTSVRGSLTLRARPESLSGRGQPSFLGRRQQHGSATASRVPPPAAPLATPTLPVPHAQSQGGHETPAGQLGQAQVQVPAPVTAAPVAPTLQAPRPLQSHAQGAHASPGAHTGQSQVHVPPPPLLPVAGFEQSHWTAGQSAFAGQTIGCTQVQPPPEASRVWQ